MRLMRNPRVATPASRMVISHQPTFPFILLPTATYQHRPRPRKGPFRIIAITPFRIALTRPSAGANPFIPPPRRQTSSDHDRRPGSELTSLAVKYLLSQIRPALPVTPSTPKHALRHYLSAGAIRHVVIGGERTSGGFQVEIDVRIGRIDSPAYSPLDA